MAVWFLPLIASAAAAAYGASQQRRNQPMGNDETRSVGNSKYMTLPDVFGGYRSTPYQGGGLAAMLLGDEYRPQAGFGPQNNPYSMSWANDLSKTMRNPNAGQQGNAGVTQIEGKRGK